MLCRIGNRGLAQGRDCVSLIGSRFSGPHSPTLLRTDSTGKSGQLQGAFGRLVFLWNRT